MRVFLRCPQPRALGFPSVLYSLGMSHCIYSFIKSSPHPCNGVLGGFNVRAK